MEKDEIFNCDIKLRKSPVRHKEKVYVGCGAGFGGDRPLGALKLLQRVPHLDYLVLECLAERTLADRYQIMMSGGDGFDSRISEWMSMLLPLAAEREICIITNMGAIDPLGAQEKVLNIAKDLGLSIKGSSTYLGAAPIVQCLERHKPQVVITSRVADAALFLGPMIYELGWNWNDFNELAQGVLAGHLLECGCQLTGGYYMHPGDKNRCFSFEQLLDLSLPFAEVSFDGRVCVAKAEKSGGILDFGTCAQQLLYEVGDPGAYITPDVVVDFQGVSFHALSNDKVLCLGAKPSLDKFPDKLLQLIPKDCGWKGWGEISYGGYACVRRAEAAEFLVRTWMEERVPGVQDHIASYIIGLDSLRVLEINEHDSYIEHVKDIRLRMDGLFDLKDHAVHFIKEFESLYTNGPAGGGGISTGWKKEIILQKQLVNREHVFWFTNAKCSVPSEAREAHLPVPRMAHKSFGHQSDDYVDRTSNSMLNSLLQTPQPAPAGQKIPLYYVAHSRAGDKGNDLNFSIIPHCPQDIERLKKIITPSWLKHVVSSLFVASSICAGPNGSRRVHNWVDEHATVEIYEVKGISSLNVVVRNALDGGVNSSRRIDRHGKTVSDLILCQNERYEFSRPI
ncbi:hypothetical protein EJ110_NYTH03293 [Nymphaea thermarum]|nr:hypothetical protein EJ110_NYTH03293 [Nymphaea thermarum]